MFQVMDLDSMLAEIESATRTRRRRRVIQAVIFIGIACMLLAATPLMGR
jgi:hypothetical protein